MPRPRPTGALRAAQGAPGRIWTRLNLALRDRPLDLIVDTSTRCNLRCRMCVLSHFGDGRDMSLRTFAALREAFGVVRHVSFTCSGEPLLNPAIVDMVALARRHSPARLSLISNGTLLDERLGRGLLEAGLDELIVSLDGASARTYEAIRVGARFGEVVSHVRLWQRLRTEVRTEEPSRRPLLGLGFVAMRQNIAELPELVRLARELGAEEVRVNGLEPYTEDVAGEILYGDDAAAYAEHFRRAGELANSLRVTLRPPRRLALRVRGERRGRASDRMDGGDALGDGVAGGARVAGDRACRPQAHIGWDGAVRPCGALVYRRPYYFLGEEHEHVPVCMGDLGKQSFLEIWRGPRYGAFRRAVKRRRFPSACGECLLSYGVIC